MTAKSTDDKKAPDPDLGVEIYKRIRKHFREARSDDILDRIEKALAEPDESETVRDEWAMACPKCGKDDELDVLASLYVRLTPDGSDANTSHDGEHAWSSLSATKCCACGHTGIAREFGDRPSVVLHNTNNEAPRLPRPPHDDPNH